MDKLLADIDRFFHLIENGEIRLSYSLATFVGIVAIILFLLLTIIIINRQQRIRRMKNEIKSKQNIVDKLDSDIKELSTSSAFQIEQLKKNLRSTTVKLECRDDQIECLNQINLKKSDDINTLSNEVKSLKTILKETSNMLREKEGALGNANLIIEKQEKEIAVCKTELSSLQETMLNLQDNVDSKIQELEIVKKQLYITDAELSRIKTRKTSNLFEYLANW